MYVVDYSFSRPSIDELKAMKDAGVVGVMRYACEDRPATHGKLITPAEFDLLASMGFGVGIVYEDGATTWRNGYAMGVHDGSIARAQANACGFPEHQFLYAAMDTSVGTPDDIVRAEQYMAGFNLAAGNFPQALYGDGALFEHALQYHFIQAAWQSESTGFPDNATPHPHAALVQHYGRTIPGVSSPIDVNDVQLPNWGQHNWAAPPTPKPVPAPAPKPAPPTTTTIDLGDEEAMQLTSFQIDMDGNGRGWHPTVPFNKFFAATPQGPYPATDGYWPIPLVAVQQRDGMALVTVEGGPKTTDGAHPARVTVFVAHA